MPSFVQRIQHWQQQFGRHHLPWQQDQDPYKVWLSEIMLQQTQVSTVLEYYQRFLQRFPTVVELARASQEEVMPYWAGLGYYARARNLHKCAQIVVQDYAGQFPHSAEVLATLPGIGKSTANAIAAFCFNATTPIMDGNVKRVFTRFFGITGYDTKTEKQLWEKAYQLVKEEQAIGQYNQGLMDLGSMICTRNKPQCQSCPLQQDCFAKQHNQQQNLPTQKPKKEQPQRETIMLILASQTHIWLQQRPQTGIWGGLLSLPELANQQELTQWLKQYPAFSAIRLASFEHIFSHYRLIIHPFLIQCATTASLQENTFPSGKWYALTELDKLALPSPVSKLLSGIKEMQPQLC